MKKQKKITRKRFFRRITALISVPTIFFMVKGIDKKKDSEPSNKFIIPPSIPNGISFFDRMIIRKTGEEIIVFSSSCTHLGCEIIGETNNKLICPCHGSKFNLNGFPITGPAVKPLKRLQVEKDDVTGEMVVYV